MSNTMSNALVLAPSECKHNWDRYEDLPGGEDPLRYRQCTKCGEIVAVMAGEHRERFHIRTIPCHVCGNPAVGRNWGRRMYAARCRWVCGEHLKPRPIFDVMSGDLQLGCVKCGADLPKGCKVHVRPGDGAKQCMACFMIAQGSDR